jgi:putative salt-induced outer membrane protein
MAMIQGSNRITGVVITLLLVLPAAPAFAQWTGKGEAGIANSTGNSESLSANAKLEVRKKVDDWEHKLGFSGVYVSNDSDATTQRWEVYGESRHTFSVKNFWYGGFRYEDDRFSGFNYQGTLSTGFGRKFIDSDKTKFSAQIGVGYKLFETRDSFDPVTLVPVPGGTDNTAVLVGGFDWDHVLTATTSIYDHFTFEAASENTFLKNEIGVTVKMTDRMALAVAFNVRHNTDPPAGFKQTDTLTTVNLVYEVK